MKKLFCHLTMICATIAHAQFQDSGPTVRWSTYQTGSSCAIKNARTEILSTAGDWQRYWSEFTGKPGAYAPSNIDFGFESIVVVHLGERASAGFSVYVESMRYPTPNDLCITYIEKSPSPQAKFAQNRTSPYVIVRFNKTVGVPRFVRRTAFSRPSLQPCSCGCRSCGSSCRSACCRSCRCGLGYGDIGYPFPVPYRVLQTAQQSNLKASFVRMITCEDEYAQFWADATGNFNLRGAPYDVDFGTDVLVAISLGMRTTAGYSVFVASCEQTGPYSQVLKWVERKPAFGQIPAQVITYPYALIRMSRFYGLPQVQQLPGMPLGQN